MKIQIKQLQQNLPKIQLNRAKLLQHETLKLGVSFINGIFLIFFIIQKYGCQLSIMTTISKIISTQLKLFSYPFFALSLLLIILSLASIIFLILLRKKNQDSAQKSLINFQQHITEKILPYLLFISEILTIPTLVIINNINNTADYSQIRITIASLICSVLSQMTIHIFKIEIPYSIKLNLIIFLPQLLPSLIAKAFAIVITYYELAYKKKYQLTYCLILTILFLSLLQLYNSGSAHFYHLVCIISTVGLVKIVGDKAQQFGNTIQQENDYLFIKIEKLNRDEKLSYQEKINIMTIIQTTKIRYDSLQEDFFDYLIINSCLPKLNQNFPQELQKEKILQFIKFKIELDHAINQNNLQLKLQRYELKIIQKTLTIRQLHEIQKIYILIKKSSNYSEILRLQKFIKKMEEYFLKEDSNINCQLIFDIDKRVEEFYNQVGKTIEHYSNLWINLFQNQIDQHKLRKLLKLLIKAQGNAYKILHKLSNQKNIEFESTIANFLHNLINANTESLFQPRKRTQQTKIKQTQYLIGTKNVILNSSLVVARRIFGRQQLLIGRKLTQILYDFEIDYFQEQLNKSQSNHEHPISSLIAFKVSNSKFKFITFQSQLRIIPDPIHGIRYFFHFNGDSGKEKNLFIYCLENDQIIGLSESMFKKFKIDEYFLSSDLFGVNLFNIVINNFIDKRSIQSTLPIKCQLNLNDLLNKKQTQNKKDPINAEIVINQVYIANELNYIIFQLKIYQEDIQKTNKQFIQQYIQRNKDFNIPNHTFSDNKLIFCRINNPLAVIIDEKLAKISNNHGINYLKISVILIIITIIITIGMLLFVRIQSQTANKSLKKEMSVVSSTNILIQQLYQLFYQYYQYYQVEIYPQQITAIQQYNMKAINYQYFSKTHKNINTIVQQLIYNKNAQKIQEVTFKFESYEANETTYKANFINFLDKIKQALATNNPQFLIRNYQVVYAFINSFVPYSTNSISNIKQSIFFTIILSIVFLAILLLLQKHLLIRIHRFRQTILKLYSTLSLKDCKKSMQRAQQLINMLQKIHLYCREKNIITGQAQINLKIRSEKLLEKEYQKDKMQISKEIMSTKLKKSYIQTIFSKNLLLITPIFLIAFQLIFSNKLSLFITESNNIVRYSSAIQNSSVLLIQRGTIFLQNAMEGQISASYQLNSTNLSTFTLSTQIKIDLPQSFRDFKIAQRKMLSFDLCEYAYMNTGSLYRNIQCSDILDGMMNMGFTETYVFLLQKIQQYKGVTMQDLGKLYRPFARYPFFMEVFYTRRTINNMLAFIQKQFVITVEKYLSKKQDELQSFVILGFCMLPLLMLAAWVFIKQIHGQCEGAIKCLRILPRSFIMRIEISKKLHRSGTLQEIQLIAV